MNLMIESILLEQSASVQRQFLVMSKNQLIKLVTSKISGYQGIGYQYTWNTDLENALNSLVQIGAVKKLVQYHGPGTFKKGNAPAEMYIYVSQSRVFFDQCVAKFYQPHAPIPAVLSVPSEQVKEQKVQGPGQGPIKTLEPAQLAGHTGNGKPIYVVPTISMKSVQGPVQGPVKQESYVQGSVKQGPVKQESYVQGSVKQGPVKQESVKQGSVTDAPPGTVFNMFKDAKKLPKSYTHAVDPTKKLYQSIVPSQTDKKAKPYEVSMNDKGWAVECTCPAYIYSKATFKYCKHMSSKNEGLKVAFYKSHETNDETPAQSKQETVSSATSIQPSPVYQGKEIVKGSPVYQGKETIQPSPVYQGKEIVKGSPVYQGKGSTSASANQIVKVVKSETFSKKTYNVILTKQPNGEMKPTQCSCPAFTYSKVTPKTCKHIESI
jgi:SWIM zinc finger